jgi:hypothetical protein
VEATKRAAAGTVFTPEQRDAYIAQIIADRVPAATPAVTRRPRQSSRGAMRTPIWAHCWRRMSDSACEVPLRWW